MYANYIYRYIYICILDLQSLKNLTSVHYQNVQQTYIQQLFVRVV